MTLDFTTQNPTTGAAQNNDAGVPTGTLSRNGVDDGAVVVTVVNKEAGVYRASYTIPATYISNDVLSLRIAATVNAVAGKGIVWHGLVTTSFLLVPGAIEYTYTVTDATTGLPIEGVEVWFSTDLAHNNIVWSGDTDTFGIAMDDYGNKPKLDAGTYYLWRQKSGYLFSDPDIEIVS